MDSGLKSNLTEKDATDIIEAVREMLEMEFQSFEQRTAWDCFFLCVTDLIRE